MSHLRGFLAVAGIALLASPLAAQEHGIVLRFQGGGYSHTMNLNSTGQEAHFKLGYAAAAGLGIQLNKYIAVQGDLAVASTKAQGDLPFNGARVNRYYGGGQLQLRYPFSGGFAPYVFGGAGRVHVDQQGIETQENFQHFTRYAATFGAGLSYAIPNSHVAILAEGKGLTYKWVAAPFNRNQLDLSYSLGVSYKIGF